MELFDIHILYMRVDKDSSEPLLLPYAYARNIKSYCAGTNVHYFNTKLVQCENDWPALSKIN